jgi:hypothetical protein
MVLGLMAANSEFQPYDVSIPYAGLAERFEQWVRDQGWTLSDIVKIEGSDRPMRFVQPTFGPPPVPKQRDPDIRNEIS